MWHVSSRSGVATLRTAIHLLKLINYAKLYSQNGECIVAIDLVTSIHSVYIDRSIAAGAGRRSSTAFSSECEQCHVVSRRSKLKTGLSDACAGDAAAGRLALPRHRRPGPHRRRTGARRPVRRTHRDGEAETDDDAAAGRYAGPAFSLLVVFEMLYYMCYAMLYIVLFYIVLLSIMLLYPSK